MTPTCGARSTVNVDRSTVNTDRVQTGLVGPGYGLDLGRAGPDTWRAVALPRHSHGPLLGSDSQRWLTVDQEALVYGPKTGSTVDQVHYSLLGHGPRALGSCTGGRRGEFPLFFPWPSSCRRRARWVSPRGGAGVQLWRGKVPSCRGDYDGGGRLTVKASQGSDHGERWIGVAVLVGESRTGRCGGWKLAWQGTLASCGSSERGG